MIVLPGPIAWIDAWLREFHQTFLAQYGLRIPEYCVLLPGQHGYGLTIVFRRHPYRRDVPKKNRRRTQVAEMPGHVWRQFHAQPTTALLTYCISRTSIKQVVRTHFPREFKEQLRDCYSLTPNDLKLQRLAYKLRPVDRVEADFGLAYAPYTIKEMLEQYSLREYPFLRDMFGPPARQWSALEMDAIPELEFP